VCGHSTTGFWNTSDLIPIVIQTSAHIGYFPVPLTELIDWIPSDVAAQVICDTFMDGNQEAYAIYNLTNPSPIPWSRLASMLRNARAFQSQVKEVTLEEWITRLEEVATSEQLVPGVRLLSLFNTVAADEWNSNIFVTKKAANASSTFRSCLEFQESWLHRSVAAWIQDGFLSA